MKPAKNTIQWLAPHLSDGEVQAIYEAVKGVIGEDEPKMIPPGEFERHLTSRPLLLDVPAMRCNELRAEQRKELSRLFGKESG